MGWHTLAVEPDTSDRSPQALERLRLDCFMGIVQSLGLTPVLRWKDTKYTLTVRKHRGLFWTTLGTVENDLQPANAVCPLRWTTYYDGYSICALSHLYRDALCEAAGAYNISFALPARLRDAFLKIDAPRNILSMFRILPVDFAWEDTGGELGKVPVLTVISPTPFSKQDWDTVRFFWPILKMQFADLSEFPDVAKYFDQFHEHYFGDAHSIYGHIMGVEDTEGFAEAV